MNSEPVTRPSAPPGPTAFRPHLLRFGVALLVLAACFAQTIAHWFSFAWHAELYSYALLVPVITAYLIWINRQVLPRPTKPDFPLLSLAVSVASAALWWSFQPIEPRSVLALQLVALLAFILAAAAACFGRPLLARVAFPIAFLWLLVPFPLALEQAFETVLQHGSSVVSFWFFKLAGMPVFREGTRFQLPGFSMEVAPECSGIHSTLALFLTSLVSGYLFLHGRWRRTALAIAVVPLALLRNGFRIFVIGELCVQISPDMINSYIHRHGGPIFFALSLIPFALLLVWLVRTERPSPAAPIPQPVSAPSA